MRLVVEYVRRCVKHYFALLAGGVFLVFGLVEGASQGIDFPVTVWLVPMLVSLSVAQYLAFADLRDHPRREIDAPVGPREGSAVVRALHAERIDRLTAELIKIPERSSRIRHQRWLRHDTSSLSWGGDTRR